MSLQTRLQNLERQAVAQARADGRREMKVPIDYQACERDMLAVMTPEEFANLNKEIAEKISWLMD